LAAIFLHLKENTQPSYFALKFAPIARLKALRLQGFVVRFDVDDSFYLVDICCSCHRVAIIVVGSLVCT
jgi:hypothetical protein